MPDFDVLIEKLRKRIPHIDGHLTGPLPQPAPILTDTELANCEAQLGFALPPLLIRIYKKLGNGGFGPGCGLMGVGPSGFPDDLDATVDSRYLDDTRSVPGRRSFGWPRKLLPICHHGCAMYSCVEADTDQMIYWEPNYWKDGRPARTALYPMSMTLHQWFDRWADGHEPFEFPFKPATGTPKIPSLYELDPPTKRKRGYPRAQLNFFDTLE